MGRLAYEHLNLRINPFGELDAKTRARVAQVDISVATGEVVQVIGHSGRGKTTHLLALHQRMPGSRYEVVPEHGDDYASELFPTAGFLIDEAQRIRSPRLKQLFLRATTLVLGTHDDLSRHCDRPIRSIALRGMTLPRLRSMMRARVEHARRGPGAVPHVPAPILQELLWRHDDDVRAIEDALYDALQAMVSLDDSWKI